MENKCNNWFQQCREMNREKWEEFLKGTLKEQLKIAKQTKSREESTMKATYNGITGELIKLERKKLYPANCSQEIKTMMDDSGFPHVYDLTIYDREKKATISFENVKLSDVRFSGAEVSFQ